MSTQKKFASLENTLSRRPPVIEQSEPPAGDQPTLAAVPTVKQPKARTATPVLNPPTASRKMSVLLPVALHRTLKRRTATDRSGMGTVILDAVESTHTQLAEHLSAQTPATPTGLFVRPKTAAAAEPSVHLTVRLPAQDIATLDELAETVGADDRSKLIRAALELYLGSGDEGKA